MKLAMVFPGQGSQSVGMLKGYDGLPGVDAVRAEALTALGADFLKLLDITGGSVRILGARADHLDASFGTPP